MKPTDDQIEARVRKHVQDNLDCDDLEFDAHPKTSRGDDAGTWVQAWVWVPDSDVLLEGEDEA